jgi:hypothetical protein
LTPISSPHPVEQRTQTDLTQRSGSCVVCSSRRSGQRPSPANPVRGPHTSRMLSRAAVMATGGAGSAPGGHAERDEARAEASTKYGACCLPSSESSICRDAKVVPRDRYPPQIAQTKPVARSDAPFGSEANSGVGDIERSPARSGEDLLGNTYLATASPNSVSALTGGEIRRS